MVAILNKKDKANTGIDRDSLVFHLQGIHLRDDICGEVSWADWSCWVGYIPAIHLYKMYTHLYNVGPTSALRSWFNIA